MDQQNAFLRSLGVDEALLLRRRDGARTVSLFCYPTAPVDALVQALAANAQPSVLLVPEGVAPGLEAASTRKRKTSIWKRWSPGWPAIRPPILRMR
ncbi:hypothetical protein G6F22_020654 [Rhizopus arrhizus]|nr:hypothetical protein G6F22_020654 [Rhizopus arrhizus]